MPDAEISSFLVAILQFKFLFPTAYTVAKMTITFLFATQAKIFLTLNWILLSVCLFRL